MSHETEWEWNIFVTRLFSIGLAHFLSASVTTLMFFWMCTVGLMASFWQYGHLFFFRVKKIKFDVFYTKIWQVFAEKFEEFGRKILTIFVWKVDNFYRKIWLILQDNLAIFTRKFDNFCSKIWRHGSNCDKSTD